MIDAFGAYQIMMKSALVNEKYYHLSDMYELADCYWFIFVENNP